MPVIARILQEHPDCGAIIRALGGLSPSEAEILTLAHRLLLGPLEAWELPIEQGPTGVLEAASALLAEARR